MQKKIQTFAFVPRHGWFVVDRIAGTPHDGSPWFIGTGVGFDINRLLVYARNENDAAEIAEEKWPDRMGDRVLRKDEAEVEENGEATFYSKNKMFTYKETRILTIASHIERATAQGGEAVLKNGKTIRYT